MQRFLFILGSGLLVASTAHAQVGLRAGASLAGYRANTNNYFQNTTTSHLGYQIGVFYQVPLGKRLSLVPEVQYSDERLTLTRTNDSWEGGYYSSLRTRLAYLNVPVLLRATFGPVYVEAGAQASALLGGRETGTFQTGGIVFTPPISVDREVASRYRRWDVGPSVGVGVKLPVGLGLSVRAYQGLASLAHDSEANTGHLYRQTLQASLTYQLGARP